MKNEKKKPSGKGRKILFISLFVLLAAGAVAAVVFFTGGGQKALAGVSVNGVDISGMTREQALEATKGVPEELLNGITLSINFGGDIREFTASQLGITTDYEEVIDQAMAYGNTGTAEEKKQAGETAKNEGKDFTVSVRAEKSSVLAALAPVKEEYDKQAEESGFTFMPWGYLPDGTPYTPDKESIMKAAGRGTSLDRPALTRLNDQDKPNELRYQYWNEPICQGHNPADADIARFLYPAWSLTWTRGRPRRKRGGKPAIFAITATGPYPRPEKEHAAHSLVDLELPGAFQLQPQLERRQALGHHQRRGDTAGRNVVHQRGSRAADVFRRMAGRAGDTQRRVRGRAGRRRLPDIEHAVQRGHPGQPRHRGRVAPLHILQLHTARAGRDHFHRLRPKIRNPYDTPIYIVSYVNPTKYNVTVEIYGPPVVDPELGEVILDFSFKDGGTFGSPTMRYVYNTSKAPDGKVIAPGKSYTYAQSRLGRKVETFKHYLSLDGKELKKESFHSYKWNPFNGITYVNGSDKPTPTPKKTPKTTRKPTLKPTQPATTPPHTTTAPPTASPVITPSPET